MAKDEGGYDWQEFGGYEVPHYTQVPDQLFDEHLRHLSGAEVKLLLWIARKTFGYKKWADDISLSQLAEGTGLGVTSVKRSVKDLEAKRLVVVKRDETKRGDAAVNTYSLRMAEGGRSKMGLPSAQNGPHKKQLPKRQRLTESEAPAESGPPAGQVASEDSDSDVALIAQETATALGRPREAKQLETLAREEGWPSDLLAAAAQIVGERLANGDGIKKPLAYLTTTVRVMIGDRVEAAKAGKRSAARQRADALAYARSIYADPVIGGNWRQVESIMAGSWGPALAAEVVGELRG